MKINYHNEDYNSEMFNIVIYLILIIGVIVYGFLNKVYRDIGGTIFCLIFVILFLILLLFSLKRYKSKKQQRNLNLYVMENGNCIKGRIIKIYDQFIYDYNGTNSHNITAEIEYNSDNENKVIAVDHLTINKYKLEMFHNKIVNIYIYNNISYIDIINS